MLADQTRAAQEFGVGLFRKVGVAGFAGLPVLTLWLVLACCPDAALAASPDSPVPGAGPSEKSGSSEKAVAKSEAAEAWDAVKDTTNPALLEAFIKRYGTTFFADIAKARLSELKAAAVKPSPADAPKGMQASPVHPDTSLDALADRFHQHAILYEEDRSTPTGRQFPGSVTWHTETIKADGKPDELAANADVYIPERGLRMTLSVRRNLDPSLPASHTIDLKCAVPADFDGGGIANIPGVLMKVNQQAKGVPLAALTVKVTDGFFLAGLSSKAGDLERNVKYLLERAWFDIPIVYANQHRAILAIDKGESGEQVFKTVFTAWGQYPDTMAPAAAIPERDSGHDGAR
jgi:hypothetical protein